ncbi:MAG TPA: bacillithiol transferase BstA [Terriglobia bacterium]|nr:bacillithiol transferase BstA [Terriglobia bacterium]
MDPRYPVGKFAWPESISEDDRRKFTAQIEEMPTRLRAALHGLSEAQLDTPYREGGWTVRQVAHHLADSHMNAFIRFKLALTETEPTIKPYEQQKWAELPDGKTAPIEASLALLDSLHHRWTLLIKSMKPEEFSRPFRHPELGLVTLERNLALYAWHSRHHVAHVTSLREQKGWGSSAKSGAAG